MLKDISKSVFLNLSDQPYGFADWEKREDIITSLRETTKQMTRLLELGHIQGILDGPAVRRLSGVSFATNYAAEQLSELSRPVRDIRQIIERYIDEIESKILSYKENVIGFEDDIHYYTSLLLTLKNIHQALESFEKEDDRIRVAFTPESNLTVSEG